MSFQINLRRIRKERGLTQADIALAAGVWQTQIANIENGRNQPSMDVAMRIAKFLDVSIDDLLRDIEPTPDLSTSHPHPRA